MATSNEVAIRAERPSDYEAVRLVNEAAFAGTEEADLVESLRRSGDVLLSLVATVDAKVVGHVMFSRMSIEVSAEQRGAGAGSAIPAVALAPVAVLPAHQGRGIGSRLIRHGLDALRALGTRIVIVVGHPEYYPRFGFSSERASGIESPFPREAFMALELTPGALGDVRGRVRYPAAFGL